MTSGIVLDDDLLDVPSGPLQLHVLALLDALRPAGVLAALEGEVAIDVGEVDDEETGVVDELVVLVRVADVDRGLARPSRSPATSARGTARASNLWSATSRRTCVVQRVGVEVPALVRVGGVLVLLEVPEPPERRELVLGQRVVRQAELLLRSLVCVGLLDRRLGVARVRDGGALQPGADELLRALERRRVVLVGVHPRRVADVLRERRPRLEHLALVVARARRRPSSGADEQVVDLGDRVLRLGGRRIHRPLVEHHLVDGERVLVLVDRPELERQRLVDLDRPGLVLRDRAAGPARGRSRRAASPRPRPGSSPCRGCPAARCTAPPARGPRSRSCRASRRCTCTPLAGSRRPDRPSASAARRCS